MKSIDRYFRRLYLSHSFSDVLFPLWKARHALRLNVCNPQVCKEYDLIQPRQIHQDIPTQIPKKFYRLLLPPTNGLKL